MSRRATGMPTGMTIAFVLTCVPVPVFAQAIETNSVKDRIEIQETLLYAYAYTYDAKDCIMVESICNRRSFGTSLAKGSRKGRDTAGLHRPTKERCGEY
jgi:hypothetical protein